MASVRHPGPAGHVLMVLPRRFGTNRQTRGSNPFQAAGPATAREVRWQARREVATLAEKLTRAGVRVVLQDDALAPARPDAVFPNNWLSFLPDGTAILYPMFAANRRLERHADWPARIAASAGLRLAGVLNLAPWEHQGLALEGTGSLVFDHLAGVLYAGLSVRTSGEAVRRFAALSGYRAQLFATADRRGRPVYHTNVMLSIGSAFAVVCSPAIREAADRRRIREGLAAHGRRLIEISITQMERFAANVLELQGRSGPLLAMSRSAYAAYSPGQRRLLESCCELVVADVPTIEQVGGGSVRCMLAEVFGQPVAPRSVPRADPTR